jgi:hypothetical protein
LEQEEKFKEEVVIEKDTSQKFIEAWRDATQQA